MSDDIASLGFQIDSSQVKSAFESLDKLSKSASGAEKSTREMLNATRDLQRQLQQQTQIAQQVQQQNEQFKRQQEQIAQATAQTAQEQQKLFKSFADYATAAAALGLAVYGAREAYQGLAQSTVGVQNALMGSARAFVEAASQVGRLRQETQMTAQQSAAAFVSIADSASKAYDQIYKLNNQIVMIARSDPKGLKSLSELAGDTSKLGTQLENYRRFVDQMIAERKRFTEDMAPAYGVIGRNAAWLGGVTGLGSEGSALRSMGIDPSAATAAQLREARERIRLLEMQRQSNDQFISAQYSLDRSAAIGQGRFASASNWVGSNVSYLGRTVLNAFGAYTAPNDGTMAGPSPEQLARGRQIYESLDSEGQKRKELNALIKETNDLRKAGAVSDGEYLQVLARLESQYPNLISLQSRYLEFTREIGEQSQRSFQLQIDVINDLRDSMTRAESVVRYNSSFGTRRGTFLNTRSEAQREYYEQQYRNSWQPANDQFLETIERISSATEMMQVVIRKNTEDLLRPLEAQARAQREVTEATLEGTAADEVKARVNAELVPIMLRYGEAIDVATLKNRLLAIEMGRVEAQARAATKQFQMAREAVLLQGERLDATYMNTRSDSASGAISQYRAAGFQEQARQVLLNFGRSQWVDTVGRFSAGTDAEVAATEARAGITQQQLADDYRAQAMRQFRNETDQYNATLRARVGLERQLADVQGGTVQSQRDARIQMQALERAIQSGDERLISAVSSAKNIDEALTNISDTTSQGAAPLRAFIELLLQLAQIQEDGQLRAFETGLRNQVDSARLAASAAGAGPGSQRAAQREAQLIAMGRSNPEQAGIQGRYNATLEAAAQDQITNATVAQFQRQAQAQNELAAAYDRGADAVARVERAEYERGIRLQLFADGIAKTAEEQERLNRVMAAYDLNRRAQVASNTSRLLSDQSGELRVIGAQRSVIGQPQDIQQLTVAYARLDEQMRRMQFATPEAAEQWKRQQLAIEANRIELDALARQAEMSRAPFIEAAKAIQSAFANVFQQILSGGIRSLRDLSNYARQIGTSIVANIGSAFAMNQANRALMSYAPGVAQAIGLPVVSQQVSNAASGGGFSPSGIGAPSGIFGGIQNSLFGSAATMDAVGFVPGTSGWLGSGGQFLGSSFAADAFLPVVGSVLPGLMSGNYAQAGLGGLGAGVGFALGGPVGAAIGGLGGNLIGGIFGGRGRGNPYVQANIALQDGRLVGTAAGDNGADPSGTQAQVNQAIAQFDAIRSSRGLIFSRGADLFGDRTGRTMDNAFDEIASGLRPGSGTNATTTAILDSGKVTGTESLNQLLSQGDRFDALIESMRGMFRVTNAAEEQVKALNRQLDEAAKFASEFNLSIDSVKSELAGDFNDQIRRSILGMTDANALALEDQERTAKARIELAKKLGADLVQVEKLNSLERQKIAEAISEAKQAEARRVMENRQNLDIRIMQLTGRSAEATTILRQRELAAMDASLRPLQERVWKLEDEQKAIDEAKSKLVEAYQRESSALENTKQKFDSFARSIRAFRDSLLTGGLSPLAPQARLDEARRQFTTVSSQAASGDSDAMSRLQGVSAALLEASRDYYASSEAYFRDFQMVQDSLSNTESTAQRESRIADDQLATMKSQLTALNSLGVSLGSLNQTSMTFAQALANLQIVVNVSGSGTTVTRAGGGGSSTATTGGGATGGGTNGPVTGVHGAFIDGPMLYGGTVSAGEELNASSIRALYQQFLGRDPEPEVYGAWMAVNGRGENLASALEQSSEFQDRLRMVRGYATGGSFEVSGPAGNDNLFLPARFEAGELINVSTTDTMKGLLAEVAAMRAEIVNLRTITAQSALAVRDAVERGNSYAEDMAATARRESSAPRAA